MSEQGARDEADKTVKTDETVKEWTGERAETAHQRALRIAVHREIVGNQFTREEMHRYIAEMKKYGIEVGITKVRQPLTEEEEEEMEAGQRFVTNLDEEWPEAWSDEPAEKILGGAAEGGGWTVLGRRQRALPSGWIFWRESCTMSLDENDDEVWLRRIYEGTGDLAAACPADLFLLRPTVVHPEFAAWVLDRLAAARRERPDRAASARWQEVWAAWEDRCTEAAAAGEAKRTGP